MNKSLKWFNDATVAKNGGHIVAFDFLNVFACICMVALHVNGAFWNFSYDRYWLTSNVIETLLYAAVPIFFMISGATLMDYRERYSTFEFVKKRFVKTFIPFVVWSVIAIVYKTFVGKVRFYDSGSKILRTIDIIFNTKAVGVYWFFIPLFAVYLSLPVISAVERNKRKKIFTYTIITAIFTISILPLVCSLLHIDMNSSFRLPIACGYIMYILIGYCITNYPISKKTRIIIYIMGIVGFTMHLLGTAFLSYEKGDVDSTFKGYLNLPCVMFSIAVFVLFFYFKRYPTHKKVLKAVRTVSSMSFGIYLVHHYVIDLLIRIFDINIVTWQWRVLGVIPVYLISLAFTLIVKKIPVLKTLVP